MRQPLKKSIRDRFEEIELSNEQLEDLGALMEGAHERRPARWRIPAIAATIVLVLTGGLLATNSYRLHQGEILLESIAQEVTDNHLKLKPLEVESGDLREVLGYFTNLDFQLLASPSITANPGDRLLGGRYCSIQGIDAAQLRVASAGGGLDTWYEATLPPDKLRLVPNLDKGQAPAEFVIRGVDIRIWQENGVVIAQAREARVY
jgi:hypothetical protein